MSMARCETSHKCVQIWYECAACGNHMLSSKPSELFEIRDTQFVKKELNSIPTKTQRFHINGASIN